MFLCWNLRLLNLSFIFSMIHACARTCSIVLGGVSKSQVKLWMDFHYKQASLTTQLASLTECSTSVE